MNKLILILSILFLISCGGDDAIVELQNQVQYEGIIYDLKDGVILDYGNDESSGYYNYQLHLTDGEFSLQTQNGNNFYVLKDAQVLIKVDLYVKGSEFKEGSFSYIEEYSTLSSESNLDLIFSNAYVNNNLGPGGPIPNGEKGTDGNVTLIKNDNKYDTSIHLIFENSTQLNAKYNASYKLLDMTL